MEDFKIELGFDCLDRPFAFIDNKRHIPTIKITLPACLADDSEAWDRRDQLGEAIRNLVKAYRTEYDDGL